MTEVKVGKDVIFIFSLGTLDLLRVWPPHPLTFHHRLPGAFAATTPQFANKILDGFNHVFKHDVAGTRVFSRLACRDIGQNFASGTQSLEAHCFSPSPQKWAVPAEENAEKIADPVASLKVEGGGVDRTDPRGGRSTSILI